MNAPLRKPEVISMGCRLNLAESNALAEQLAEQDDMVIVNSCAVTNEAVRQTRQAIRQAHKRRPDARIWVTGCAAQVEPGTFAADAGSIRRVWQCGKAGCPFLRGLIGLPDRR